MSPDLWQRTCDQLATELSEQQYNTWIRALPPAELAQVPTVCGSLREALESLEADHDYLLQGGVFTKDQIESYIELKWPEVLRWETTPSAVEFDMYYSL